MCVYVYASLYVRYVCMCMSLYVPSLYKGGVYIGALLDGSMCEHGSI